MPDYYDITELRVRNVETVPPIVWERDIRDRTHTDSRERNFRTQNSVNEPRSDTTMTLADGYSFPDGWRMGQGGRLYYRAILGQSIPLKVTAHREGVPSVDSNEFRITRYRAFETPMVPSRIYVGLGFNNATQRLYLFNSETDEDPDQYINAFNIDGAEQLSESLNVRSVSPPRLAGGCFDGTHFWLSGGNWNRTESYLKKIDASGSEVGDYTFSSNTGINIESLTFDGTYIWGLDLFGYKLRKFNTSGVEQSGTISLARAETATDYDGYWLTDAQYGLAYADGHFWIVQSHIAGETWIFCCDTSGTRVRSRDIEIDDDPPAGLTYNPTTDNLWWIHDRTNEDGNRYGTLEAKQI